MRVEDAEKAVKKHGSQAKAANALGVAKSTVWAALHKSLVESNPNGQPSPDKSRQGRAIGDFRAAYDKDFIVPRKIKAGLRTLGAGWEYEVAFAKMCGASLSDIGNYRSQFADHVVDIRRESKRAWAGTTKTAEQMRAML